MSLEVQYIADYTSPSGYSKAARNHVRALVEQGVTVYGTNTKHDITDVVHDPWWVEHGPAIIGRPEVAGTVIHHSTCEFMQPHPAQHFIAMLTFECDRIPSTDVNGNPRNNWVRQLNRCNEIFTFADFTVDVFRRSGVREDIPINVFPHPIDTEEYSPGEKIPLYDGKRKPISKDTFVLGSVFQWQARKAPYRLLSAYMSAFGPDDDVVLLLKTYSVDFSEQSKNLIRKQLEEFKKFVRKPGGLPRVMLCLDPIPDGEMTALHRAIDVYVTATYGEGFGLPVQGSMACGVPAIVPNASAFPDFVKPDNGWLVSTSETPVFGMQFPWYEVGMYWWEVNGRELAEAMRYAYENREEVKQKGLACRKFVEENHTFEVVGKAMRSRLEQIQEAR